jgi:8-amino-7-oxononanoate synthase
MGAALSDWIGTTLAAQRASGRERALESRDGAQGAEITISGRTRINFSSNDYLGLAAHPRVLDRVSGELSTHGFGSGSAALLGGRSTLHAELERELADVAGVERALLFSSGYLANLGALGCLITRGDYVAHDRLNHASLIDGVIASRARHARYAHTDVEQACRLLQGAAQKRKWLVTESLFSMDGNSASLQAAADVCRSTDASLYVDDAHGFGILSDGYGASRLLDRSARANTVFMVTLGKSLGAVGAVVLGPGQIIEFLIQRSRTFIYDTALPAVCAAAALEALAILRSSRAPYRRLQENIACFRAHALHRGLPLVDVSGPIQPLLIGDDHLSEVYAEKIRAQGYYVRAIRPPTVPVGTSRLRLTITASHTKQQIHGLVETLREHCAR